MSGGIKMLWVIVLFAVVAECRHIDTDPTKSCMFGQKTVRDGKVAMHVPEKCVSLVCKEGKIVEKMTGAAGDTGCCVCADNKMYPHGFKYPVCIPVTCTNGTWVPQKEIDPCCGYCEVYGFSHFTTSDGHRYDWHGYCNYTLLTLTHAKTHEAKTTAIFAEMNRIGSCATQFGQITFHADPHTIINITRGADFQVSQQIDINGETMTIPRTGTHVVTSSSDKHGVLAYWRRDCLLLQGLEITLRYCPLHLDIWTPRNLKDSVNGLCGHFNYNSMDDFTSTVGQILPLETFPVEYPDRHWRAPTQINTPCKDHTTTTSICNGTLVRSIPSSGNKCREGQEDIDSYQRACYDFLHQLYPNLPEIVQYYVPPCTADLCLAAQRDVDFTIPLSAFVTQVLKGYENITLDHFHDMEDTPLMMDKSTCSLETSTAIPVDKDEAHTLHTTTMQP